MEKPEVRDAVARYVKKFSDESKRVQQRMNEANAASEVPCVVLVNISQLALNLLDLQNNESLTDVCINCSDGFIFVHSGILMAASTHILNHFIKTNHPENFDQYGRRHLDMKSFTVQETASVLFLFYTGSSMFHDLDDNPNQSVKEGSTLAKQKLLMKILARFGTNSSSLVMSVPISGTGFFSSADEAHSLRFSRKEGLKNDRVDFFISKTGEIRPTEPVAMLTIPCGTVTPAVADEDCQYCPIICTLTSSKKVHLEDCKYATFPIPSPKRDDAPPQQLVDKPVVCKIEPPEVIFIPAAPPPPVISTPVVLPPPVNLQSVITKPDPDAVGDPVSKAISIRKESPYNDIRRTFDGCKVPTMKRVRPSSDSRDQSKHIKVNKENYRPKESSSDSEAEEPQPRIPPKHKRRNQSLSQQPDVPSPRRADLNRSLSLKQPAPKRPLPPLPPKLSSNALGALKEELHKSLAWQAKAHATKVARKSTG